MYSNARDAVVGELANLLHNGAKLESRNGEAMEVCGRRIIIEHPTQRCLVLPHRQDNIFAKIAETMWVLAGRDDLQYLSSYLPRAIDFSDDGKVWRAAYGPRLFRWNRYGTASVNQVAECLRLLKEDPSTRRAVMVIFDPTLDYVVSKDIPCNNWIQWLIRGGKLQMHVALRSNDAMWGFSGINTFEWSYLHEMMAYWLDVGVGTYNHYVGSFHMYQPHYARAQDIIQGGRVALYPTFESPGFGTAYEGFEGALQRWLWLELRLRAGALEIEANFDDPLLDTSIIMLALYHSWNNGRTDLVKHYLRQLGPCDFQVAAVDWLLRHKYNASLLKETAPEAYQFCIKQDQTDAEVTSKAPVTTKFVCQQLITLEAKKTISYGDSWRKHGEMFSIFPNISRKFDRLERVFAGATPTADENICHTLGDLAVYAAKYISFLWELINTKVMVDFSSSLLGSVTPDKVELGQCLDHINVAYHTLESVLTSKGDLLADSLVNTRLAMATKLVQYSVLALVEISWLDPELFYTWVRSIQNL